MPRIDGFPLQRQRRAHRGAVLILVLGAVSILSVLAVEMTHRSHLDSADANRTERESAFRRGFDSGVAIAKGLIAEGRISRGYDFLGDPWHRTVTAECGDRVRVTVRVEDESGKLNLQALAADARSSGTSRKALARVFEYLVRQSPAEKEALERAEQLILKRISAPDSAGTGRPAPEPLFTLDGLREAGIPRALLFGELSADVTVRAPALCELLTVWGDARINLNTAPKAILYSLDPEFDEELVERIAAWRGETATGARIEYRPFKQEKDLELVEGIVQRVREDDRWKTVKNLHAKVADRLTVRSTVFSARLEAEVEGRRRLAWAVFQVGPGGTSAEQQVKAMKLLAYEEIEP